MPYSSDMIAYFHVLCVVRLHNDVFQITACQYSAVEHDDFMFTRNSDENMAGVIIISWACSEPYLKEQERNFDNPGSFYFLFYCIYFYWPSFTQAKDGILSQHNLWTACSWFLVKINKYSEVLSCIRNKNSISYQRLFTCCRFLMLAHTFLNLYLLCHWYYQ